ncbi:LuxR family transcriptional regulator [Chelativorans sp.]|uniref:LuxR family transcriptional regulator n=1 Tax=Chelativorans sp. TaxID=2203393 RepID=UPI0028111D30|nr:LuxR family transcriptional regulator [Chelativorans sp.]
MNSEAGSLGDLDASIFDTVKAARDVEAAVEIVRDGYQLSHATFHLGHTPIEPIDAPYVKSTYPPEWLGRYLVKRYFLVDPVAKAGFEMVRPFYWHELDIKPEAAELMVDAEKHGIGSQGYSIPVLDKDNRRSLFTVTSNAGRREWDAFVSAHQAALAEIAFFIHTRALAELYGTERPFPHLSEREIECLALTAQGKDSKDIAAILDLSENTTKAYLKTVRIKLQCSTMAQAVAKAIHHRIISR